MTKFAVNTMNVTEWAPVQDLLGSLQMSLGGPHDLMMFIASPRNIANQTIIIGVPDAVSLSLFPGFKEISRDQIPQIESTLVIRNDGFKDRFPEIKAKMIKH